MTAITFDTLKFVHILREAGFEEKQAEAVSRAFREAQGEAELATKGDISRLEAKLDSRLQSVEAKLESLELRMTIRLGGMMAAAVVLTAALVKLL